MGSWSGTINKVCAVWAEGHWPDCLRYSGKSGIGRMAWAGPGCYPNARTVVVGADARPALRGAQRLRRAVAARRVPTSTAAIAAAAAPKPGLLASLMDRSLGTAVVP
jgi:hypothetical protein